MKVNIGKFTVIYLQLLCGCEQNEEMKNAYLKGRNI